MEEIDKTLKQLIPFKPGKRYKVPDIPELKEGQCVIHRRFGKGFIISADGDKCTVLLSFGTKELLSRFCNFNND